MPREYGPPEAVLVENDWYDGPRAGVCYINHQLHRYESNFDEKDGEWLGTFRILPISQEVADLEVEQWRIFVEWNIQYESSKATVEEHPASGGINQ